MIDSFLQKRDEKMNIKEGSWDAGRVLQALGRIGYDPVAAILDIVDNSVSAGATSVTINVNQEGEKGKSGHSQAVLKSFSIVDNGCGMDEDGLDNALTLGSSTELYHANTLSKFGMGLKSAASSLGKRLEVVSRSKDDLNKVRKVVLDHDLIAREGKYIYDLTEPREEDLKELEACTQGKSGTLIHITGLFHESLPRTSEIIHGLKTKAGVIYYYYLKGIVEGSELLSLKIDDHDIVPVDPLFVDEIDTDDPDLNEKTWDGLSPKWITKPQRIPIDTTGTRYAELAVTQLPHPPIVGLIKSMDPTQSMGLKSSRIQTRCRNHYLIESGNYGFYIYRNWRLISWADSLDFVRQDQNLYAFRGRLLINSDADDVLNIDVTKSRIYLSELAQDHLKPRIQEALKKSRNAWNKAKQTVDQLRQQDPHDVANEELNRISHIQAEEDKRDESVAPLEEKQELEARRTKAISTKPIKTEDLQLVSEAGQCVLYVDTLENDQLWERAHDPAGVMIVRINRSHRFCREVLDIVHDNSNLLKVIDVLFFSIARGEYDLVYKSEHDDDEIEKVMEEYRERVGRILSDIIRKLNLTDFLTDV